MKKTLCLLVMMLVLLPSVAVSQNKINRSRFQHNRLLRLAAAFESFLDISSPLRKYLSDLYKTDFDNIGNAPDVLRSLMPKTVAYAQERMATQYGIDISVLFSPAKSPGRKGVLPNKPTLPPELARFAGVLVWGMTVVSCYWLVDEVGARYIIYDLEHNSNFTHDKAVAAAEHITAEGAEEAGRFVDSYSIVPLPFWEHLAKLANFIEALIEASDNDPNILQVVMLAVSVPLLILLVVQYRSLTQLGQTLPIANRDLMRKYLAHLAAKVEDFYKTNSEYALSIPRDVFADARNQSSMPGIVSYIEQHPAKGAKRVFVAMIEETAAGDIYPSVFFYDPNAEYKFRRERNSPHWRAAHTASGHYLYQAIAKINLDVPPVTIDEQDPEDRVITRPVLDTNSIVTSVTGMIIDNTYFKEKLLPELIQDSLETFFPSDYQDIIIILQDGAGNRLFETQPSEGKDFEVAEPLRFLFKDLSFKVVMRSNSVEQSARTVVALNFSLSVIMTGLLIAGIYLALRTASREMRLSRMKSDFVSNVSHELRTPLASIRVFGEFFKSGWVDEPQKSREYGEYIENESRRLTHLINNILERNLNFSIDPPSSLRPH